MKKIQKHKVFEVYEDFKGNLYTVNFAPGTTVYDERLLESDGKEYRSWNHNKSKLGAAIKKGTPNVGIRSGSVVLYLGASSGTTPSHVSDMVGKDGFVFALDFAPRVVRELVFVCEDRKNMAPLLADALQTDTFSKHIEKPVDVVFQDIAQRNQTQIFLKNCDKFLKKGGYGLLALKARSVDVSKNPRDIFKQVRKELEAEMIIIDERKLDPFEKDHMFYVCKKK